jgi:hypothetical protein
VKAEVHFHDSPGDHSIAISGPSGKQAKSQPQFFQRACQPENHGKILESA